MFNQFLYGEVTGIQVGHWLYDAPDLEAAKFLARSRSRRCSTSTTSCASWRCSAPAQPAHPAVRFLATGMMGGSWAEHVALEMAQGEGFVLQAFYAVIDTLDHKPSVDILRRAVKQEERHVEFGEEQTKKAIEGSRGSAAACSGCRSSRCGACAGSRASWRSGCRRTTWCCRTCPRSSSTRPRAPSCGCAGSACWIDR